VASYCLIINYLFFMKEYSKTCANCGENIEGRSDKKFCDDNCRTAFNNGNAVSRDGLVRSINYRLMKNRRILQDLIPEEGKIKVSGQRLSNAGFEFKYHTHTYTTQKGATYVFCYDFGYLALDNNFFMLVKRVEGPIPAAMAEDKTNMKEKAELRAV
jgi:hypothetical protein